MPHEIVMPKLGLNMTEGLLTEWIKREGDQVQRGETLFVVETEKATADVEAQTSGTLVRILVREGQTVSVATVVGIIAETNEVLNETDLARYAGAALSTANAAPVQIPDAALPLTPAEVKPEIRGGDRLLASPVAKRIAKEHGIDLATVTPSGRDGRIVEEDVRRAIGLRQEEAAPGVVIPITGTRATIAARMAHSAQSTARVTLHMEVDAGRLVAYRERRKAEPGGYAPSYNSLLIVLVARALHAHPALNARQVQKAIHLLEAIHVGLAVDTERGLLVVVIRDADAKSIDAVDAEVERLAERAHTGVITPDELSGGTFTITNLGAFEVDSFTPVINWPEIAILGVGRIAEKPIMRAGQITSAHLLRLSLSFDHRLVDGAPAARFLQHLKTLIEAFDETQSG